MRILVRLLDIRDGLSFYRGHGVLAEMQRMYNDVRVEIIDRINYFNAKGASIAYFQAPFLESTLEEIRLCKDMNIPVVVDYDDNYYCIPTNNRFHIVNKMQNIDHVKNVKEAIELADRVTVSTEALEEVYGCEYKTTVINNAWDNFTFPNKKFYNYNKVILWRGGSSHKTDFAVFEKVILDIIEEYHDFTFHFVGDPPVSVGAFRNVVVKPLMPVIDYFRYIRSLNPGGVIVPLDDNKFNHGKSNIAKIEATMIGAVSIVPAWDEWIWDKDSLLETRYTDVDSFYEEVCDLIRAISCEDRTLEEEFGFAKDVMEFKYNLKYTNSKRYDLFKFLAKDTAL